MRKGEGSRTASNSKGVTKGISCTFWCIYFQGMGNGLERHSSLLHSSGKDSVTPYWKV